MDLSQMHVTPVPSDTPSSSPNPETSKGSFKIKLPTVDVQDCSDISFDLQNDDEYEPELAIVNSSSSSFRNTPRMVKSPTVLTPPQCTPRSASPIRSPTKISSENQSKSNQDKQNQQKQEQKQHLQVGNPSSIFRLPKPQVKLLKKTASVKQLYNSVLHAIKTIASTRDEFMPELTKTFFENILRASDDSPKLQVR